MSENETPHLYLLQMDSSFALETNDRQVLPFHILNSSPDFNQYVSIKETRNEVELIQPETLNDIYQESAATLTLIKAQQNTTTEDTDSTYETEPIQIYLHISDQPVVPRAIGVLPRILQISRKEIISPRRTIHSHTRFGPVQGVKHEISSEETKELVTTSLSNSIPLFIVKNKDKCEHIDVSDRDKSNWIGLLPLGDENTANLWIYEENNELYVITTEAIPSRKPLMLGYSKKYADQYGFTCHSNDILRIRNNTASSSKRKWWCHECQRAMSSASLLQRHLDTDHQDIPVSRRRLRCRFCKLSFSRLFTLRRHVARYCEKKNAKSVNNVESTEAPAESNLNISTTSEENRLPSDESFQNYSNGLDFSTNLFDTDRMPNLDLSGNSRSEFNPFVLDTDIPLANDLGYSNGLNKSDISNVDKDKQEETIKTSVEPCPYCHENVAKGKQRQHVSECTARHFECECKKVFTSKELLTAHFYSHHKIKTKNEETPNGENNTDSANLMQYPCDQCELTFKRRGMLVNHLWRVHKTSAAAVPMHKRVRHYPCGACPKLYRSAAKRDRHLKVHHPGWEAGRLAPVEGGTRACPPAQCPLCVRQYATRAKMVQHMRQHHLQKVPPVTKKKTNLKRENQTNDQMEVSEETLKNDISLQQMLILY